MNCRYAACRMRNLCKSHCVRAALEKDGWAFVDGQLVHLPLDTDLKNVQSEIEARKS